MSHYEAPIREPLIIGHKTYHDITEDIARPIEVRALFNDKRKYVLLEEVGTKPNVFYHTKVRNRKENNV